jgi:hypothetical protein
VLLLRKAVERHLEQHEQALMPALLDRATPAQLDGLAARVLQVQQRVG